MKLNSYQLETHLAKSLAPLYVVSGDDVLQKNDALQLLRKAAKAAGYTERLRLSAEVLADQEQLYSSLYSNSLFTEKRLLELDLRESTPNKVSGQILQEYAEKPAADTLLLIDSAKIDPKVAKSAWYKAFEKSGVVIAIWPVPREQLPKWIQNRARKYKLQFHPDAANLLADYVEGNLIAAAQTIEKLYLLKPEKNIDTEIIQTILTDESRFTLFDFIDSLLAGSKSRSLHILESLREEGLEPILIVWGITRELRILADLSKHIASGKTYDQVFQQQRIFPKRQPLMRRFLDKFSARDCWQLLSQAAELDRIIKGASPGNIWQGLQLFCLRLS